MPMTAIQPFLEALRQAPVIAILRSITTEAFDTVAAGALAGGIGSAPFKPGKPTQELRQNALDFMDAIGCTKP